MALPNLSDVYWHNYALPKMTEDVESISFTRGVVSARIVSDEGFFIDGIETVEMDDDSVEIVFDEPLRAWCNDASSTLMLSVSSANQDPPDMMIRAKPKNFALTE